MNSAKKRRIDSDDQKYKVTIAPYNDSTTSNDTTFDRSHPHLEGRWVGHIHLPLPSFESLDWLQQVDCNEGQEGAPSAHDEQTSGDTAVLDEQAIGQSSDDESSSNSSSSSSDEEDDMPQSRMFLPIARQLIHQWAKLLGDCSPVGDEQHTPTSDTLIVPLIPMDRTTTPSKKDTLLKSKSPTNKQEEVSTSESHLHISLSRPIYLPTPSVDPFLSDIQKNLSTVINAANSRRRGSGQSRIVNLQPQNTVLLTNDTSTRTFLSIPISTTSSNWIKKSILPIVDATMLKFGLLSYYNDNNDNVEEENGKGKDGKGGCILHVSIASIRGNVIPQILLNRNNNNSNQHNNSNNNNGDVEKIRSILLFTSNEQEDTTEEKMEGLMPSYIPIRVNCIQCEFGKVKKLTIPL